MVKLGKVASAVKSVLLSLGTAERTNGGELRLSLAVLVTLTERSEWWVRKAVWVAKTNGYCHWNKDGVKLTPEGRVFLTTMGEDDAAWAVLKGAELLKSEVEAATPKAPKEKKERVVKPSETALRLTALEANVATIAASLSAIVAALPKPKAAKAVKAEEVVTA